MTKTQDAAVRNYLVSLRDPTALRDDDAIADLQSKIEQSTDELERLQLRQQLLDLQTPPLDRYEDAFVKHAKAWADADRSGGALDGRGGVPVAVVGTCAVAAGVAVAAEERGDLGLRRGLQDPLSPGRSIE